MKVSKGAAQIIMFVLAAGCAMTDHGGWAIMFVVLAMLWTDD